MENNVVNDEVIKAEVQDGLKQVDENLSIDQFTSVYDQVERRLQVNCTAINSETGERFDVNNVWR